MKNSLCPVVVVAALLGPLAVRAQAPNNAPTADPAPAAGLLPPTSTEFGRHSIQTPTPSGGGGGDARLPTPPGITDYLGYLRPGGCCGPVGGSGPINFEIVFRPGVSFPMGGSVPGNVMDPGFMIQGGLRTLFFNPAKDLAWTVEVGLTSVWYDAHRDRVVNLTNVDRVIRNANGTVRTNNDGAPIFERFPVVPVIPSSLNETYVHLALGHEIYVCGNADCGDDGPKVRVGYDAGGRWGSAKLIAPRQPFIGDNGDPRRDFPNHFNDVVGGLVGALHADYEIPFKCAMIHAGVRTEFSYIWADLLQRQNNTDLMSINLLFNLGCRF
ncbi:MAG: hypothetical protein U0797_14045 [Gemmataceae bacterium]